jgi:hypothetical protein
MHRSSDAIASIATALAKAQVELTNPEKSLVATIRATSRENDRTFRYASLAAGLDIMRRCLGKYEIATIQTTVIDRDMGMVRLATILAHSSGEWLASDWPVCPVGDVASPQRMGSALTYARRYSLFTLVGIAGEDDLDAPDLLTEKPGGSANIYRPGGRPGTPAKSRASFSRPAITALDFENSAIVRERLESEIEALSSAEDLALWGHRSIRQKDALISSDAKLLEDAFRKKLATFKEDLKHSLNQPSTTKETLVKGDGQKRRSSHVRNSKKQLRRPGPEASLGKPSLLQSGVKNTVIDKSLLSIPTIKRHRNKEHLRSVASKACLVCGRQPSDPHHLRFAQQRGLGLKVSDEFTVPLCRIHHREAHQKDDERKWWEALKIEPLRIARSLWQNSVGQGQCSETEQL